MKQPYTLIAAVSLGSDLHIHIQCWEVHWRDGQSDQGEWQIWWCHDYHEDSHLEQRWYSKAQALAHFTDLVLQTMMGMEPFRPQCDTDELERWQMEYNERYSGRWRSLE